MDSLNYLDLVPSSQDNISRMVVRLRRSYWHDDRGLHMRLDLTPLKKRCNGHDFIREDASMIGADCVFSQVTNLGDCLDGIYMVATCDEKIDWETGLVDDWNYRLVPIEEEGR